MKPEPTRYSAAYKRGVVLLLMTAYTFNAMDRNIIAIISQSMKFDLKLSDTQLGLLGGTAFAVLYAFGGIPIARLAERVSRVNIITAALIIWSALSALCGAASSFPQLLLIRAGVGVAESGCSPPAHSLISDYFEPSRRTSALSVYSCGTSLGYLLAAVAGGYAAQHWGWRAACVLVGLPGLAIALLIKATIREPPRGHSEAVQGHRDRRTLPPFSLRSEFRELSAVVRALLTDRPVCHMVLGVSIGGFAAYGFYAFVPAYFSRTFDLAYGTIGIVAGLAGGVAVGFGIVAGGFVADRLARRGARWYALVPAIGGCIAAPLYLIAVVQPDWRAAAGLLALAGFFQYASLGPDLRCGAECRRERQARHRDGRAVHLLERVRARRRSSIHGLGDRPLCRDRFQFTGRRGRSRPAAVRRTAAALHSESAAPAAQPRRRRAQQPDQPVMPRWRAPPDRDFW